MTRPDPFRHHPNLRGKIIDPEHSFFRDFRPERVFEILSRQGMDASWCRSEDAIERDRHAAYANHEGDLWFFAYGSLMWDPAVPFAEVRRARVYGFARSFCLVDDLGGRGNAASPGLMAALDTGHHCNGLVFRIEAADVEEATHSLWSREMIGTSYLHAVLPAETDFGPVPATSFIVNPEGNEIRRDISRADQVRFLARGRGFLGTSFDYLKSVVDQFDALGIEDADVQALYAEVLDFMARDVTAS
ncbi:MAG: gamma-glutamylcyclotransferase [Pseudomonadota bacterium]